MMSKLGLLPQIMENGRLAWRLMNDSRVPRLVRHGIPLGMFLYFVMPFDAIPDFIPVVGELDDLGVMVMGMNLMVRLAPQNVVDEHRRALGLSVSGKASSGSGDGYWSTPSASKRTGGQPTQPLQSKPHKPIEGEYSVRTGDES